MQNLDQWFSQMQAQFYGQAQEIINKHMLELREELDAVHVSRLEKINNDLGELFGLAGTGEAQTD
ncbi:hypothetical protein J9253_05940 [Thiothrix litoralis]|jgi:hypothetical protein|uniref:Uncharacterized protein n=1 Tax=Thiothrix litoralis TaxID=2891210 RepID=A0ABX7WYB2_9GAMM|nr:hypothetical protein [Thiothrix litoralis]QTR47473.1 hypothetical protein J9253_05940 [Thiothrix litoralis]